MQCAACDPPPIADGVGDVADAPHALFAVLTQLQSPRTGVPRGAFIAGTAGYVFGLAYGINAGILPAAEYVAKSMQGNAICVNVLTHVVPLWNARTKPSPAASVKAGPPIRAAFLLH